MLVGVPSLNRGGRRYRDTMGMFVGVMGINVPVTPDMQRLGGGGEPDRMQGARILARYPLGELARELESVVIATGAMFDMLLSPGRQDYQGIVRAAELVESRQLFSGVARYPLGITVWKVMPSRIWNLLEGSAAYFHRRRSPRRGASAHRAGRTAPRTGRGCAHPVLVNGARCTLRHATMLASTSGCIRLSSTMRPRYRTQVGLVWDGGSMDYRTLDGLANQLALRLVRLGAGRDRIVAVAMSRSPDLVVAMLAIGKAGAAYLPLDPDAPVARLGAVLQDAGAVAVLVQAESWERLGYPRGCSGLQLAESLPFQILQMPAPGTGGGDPASSCSRRDHRPAQGRHD